MHHIVFLQRERMLYYDFKDTPFYLKLWLIINPMEPDQQRAINIYI